LNIIGEKVLLRAIEITDKDVLLSIINDSETEHSLGGWSFPVSSLSQEEWIKTQKQNTHILRCMIDDIDQKKAIGTVILSNIDYKNGNAEIHIKLLKDIRGKGFGSDAIRTLVQYSFNELRLNCVYAHVNVYNEQSLNLFKKCGFFEEGVLKSRIFKKGAYHDVMILSVIKEVY
jgi:RimJ/RimL family protein N-acetyltransferase